MKQVEIDVCNSNEKLKQIQILQKKCLEDLDMICNENDLEYSIAYGTFLGAVRHKDVIPWDDDLDVCMPYKDCIKLGKLLPEKYYWQSTKSNPAVPLTFYKIRINGTKMVQNDFRKLPIHQGIWIDIFPYVNAPKSMLLKKIQFSFQNILQAVRCKEYNKVNGKKNIVSVLPNVILKCIDSFVQYIVIAMGSEYSSEYLVLSNDTFQGSYLSKAYLDEISLYQLGDHCFRGPDDYDGYLKKYYGDNYMIPNKWSHLSDYSDVIIDIPL